MAGSAAALATLGMSGGCISRESRDGGVVEDDPSSSLPDGLDPGNFKVHGLNPITAETRRELFGLGAITPLEYLFIRNNLPIPDDAIVDEPDGWNVAVEGVADERMLTVAELKEMGAASVASVLQCSGNGRGFFEHGPSGSPWLVGAAGCVIWGGVPVSRVADALGGVSSSGRYLTGTGGEVLPDGLERDATVVERSIPVQKALSDALLAWEVNGEPIPISHGGPLRLVVPGYYGVNHIKYVKQISFTESETAARIMTSSYRVRPIGKASSTDQPTMWAMNVKSWINGIVSPPPHGDGPVTVYGVAFGGENAVTGVEISTDDGASWIEASFIGPDLGRFAWRVFTCEINLGVDVVAIASRATDSAGTVQPAERVENERGYGNNSWRDHAFEITTSS